MDFGGEGGGGKHISLAAISEGKHLSLVIRVRGNTYHGGTHITVTSKVAPATLLYARATNTFFTIRITAICICFLVGY